MNNKWYYPKGIYCERMINHTHESNVVDVKVLKEVIGENPDLKLNVTAMVYSQHMIIMLSS